MNKQQIIVSPSGERMVVLPESEFERLRDAAEALSDVAAYDDAKRALAAGEEELLPAAMVERLLGGESPIRVWREHRRMSLLDLAKRTGLSQGYLSQLETRKKTGSLKSLRVIAASLGIHLEDVG
jgi:DNA-binding Xre family transcriptional regulator